MATKPRDEMERGMQSRDVLTQPELISVMSSNVCNTCTETDFVSDTTLTQTVCGGFKSVFPGTRAHTFGWWLYCQESNVSSCVK